MSSADEIMRAVGGSEDVLERGDLLVADRFVSEVGQDFRFVPGLDWHRWTGAAWRPCELSEHVEACKGVVRRALDDAGVPSKAITGATQASRMRGALAGRGRDR